MNSIKQRLCFWAIPLFVGLVVAFPFLYALLLKGGSILYGNFASDAYHYLAIARKSIQYGMYSYDGLTVTNGFHPFWQYFLRGFLYFFDIKTHAQQAITVLLLSVATVTIGSVLTSAAIIRVTNQKYLGLIVVPGFFYLTVGVHSNCLSIWQFVDGMESGFSTLFGGIFYFTLSNYIKKPLNVNNNFDLLRICQLTGLTIPFIVFSRLDDVFLIPAFLIAILLYKSNIKEKLTASLWICVPTGLVITVYLIYNIITVGAAMPLSGSTKSGFVGAMTLYLTTAIHFPPIVELKNLLVAKQSDNAQLFLNRFRFIEMFYPLLAAIFGILLILEKRINSALSFVCFSICCYIIIKVGYNFLFVHPWHQSHWYYAFMSLSLTVLSAIALNQLFRYIELSKIGQNGLIVVYCSLMLLLSSSYFYQIINNNPSEKDYKLWENKDLIYSKLKENDVTGLINVDDGITAFLFDFPAMHGFAFATDVEAQKAYRNGKMLSLALSRGINTITGATYMPAIANSANATSADLLSYLKKTLAWETMYAEADKFQYSLVYYDNDLHLPFIKFQAMQE